MLKKPIAVVILIASIIIAAFVGGYVAEQFKTHVAAVTPAGNAIPVDSNSGTALSSIPVGAPSPGKTTPGGRPSSNPGSQGGVTSPPPPQVTAPPSSGGAVQPPIGATVPPGASTTPGSTGTAPATIPPPPPPKAWYDVVVPADTLLTIKLLTPISSETSKLEDPVEAIIAKDVMVGNEVAIRQGTRVLGSIMEAQKGSSPSIGVRFHTLFPRPGVEVQMRIAPVIQRIEGGGRSGRGWSTIILGTAAGVAVGGLTGGTQGAVKGGAAGVAGGAAAVTVTQKPKSSEVPAGSSVPVQLIAPITVMIER